MVSRCISPQPLGGDFATAFSYHCETAIQIRDAMFRHIGVSIDSSDHSSEATILALEFARTGGARISLRYAQSMRGDLLAQAHGVHRANEASTRAEAAARALGVPGKSTSLVTQCPAHDILNAAKLAACDAVIAAHDPADLRVRGGSTTVALITQAAVPVLTFGRECMPARVPALDLMRTEYQRLATLIHKWLCLLGTAHTRGEQSLSSYRSTMYGVIEYIRSTVHPLQACKAAKFFGRIRPRVESVRAEIDELLLLDQRKQLLLEELESKVAGPLDYEAAVTDLLSALRQYANLIWTARGREEGVILPAARRHLTAQDWSRLHAGFTRSCRGKNGASVLDRFACMSDALYEAALNGIRPGLVANFLEA